VWAEPFAVIAQATHYELMSAELDPGASQFGSAIQVDPKDIGDGSAAYPSLAMAPNGQAYVVYRVVTDNLLNNQNIIISGREAYINDFKTTITNYASYYADGTQVANSAPAFPNNIPAHTLISYFGRLNYSYKDRYLLTATMRRDGSSRFSEDNRWGYFPSAAVAWNIYQEDFLKNSKTVSSLRLRVGYGLTGQQDGIPNYASMIAPDLRCGNNWP